MEENQNLNNLAEIIENNRVNGSNINYYTARYTITFGELIEAGFNWGKEEYFPDWGVDNEHRVYLNKLIENRFYFREISYVPPIRWKMFLVSTLDLVLPKYNLQLELLTNNINLLQKRATEGKRRDVFSDFPQSQLQKDTEDYAKSANDIAQTEIEEGDVLDKYLDLQNKIRSIWELIINDLEKCFLSIIGSLR